MNKRRRIIIFSVKFYELLSFTVGKTNIVILLGNILVHKLQL